MRFRKSKPSVHHRQNRVLSMKMPYSLCLCGEDHSGFTLVEILLALFIFTIVLSLIYTSYTGTFRIVDETEYQADIYRMARIAIERIYEDLESVYAPQDAKPPESDEEDGQFGRFEGKEAEIDGNRADRLSFTSRAHLVFSEEDQPAGTAVIEYLVEENEENEEEGDLLLFRKDTPGVGETPDEESRGLVLCEQLQSVSFTYYDAEGEAHENWDSTSEEFENMMPSMVSVLLEFVNKADPEAPFKFLTTVTLPMGGGGKDEESV
jgi:general secretion pathway protein J